MMSVMLVFEPSTATIRTEVTSSNQEIGVGDAPSAHAPLRQVGDLQQRQVEHLHAGQDAGSAP
jgi:hypothetical protein